MQAAVHHKTPGQGLTPEAAFTAHTEGGWQAAGVTGAGTLTVGAPATYAVWDREPDLTPGATLPTCLRTVHNGHTLHQDTGVSHTRTGCVPHSRGVSDTFEPGETNGKH